MPDHRTYAPEDLRDYYEANTQDFARFGEGQQAIHRAVWAPGITSKAAAFRYVDERVLAELRELEQGHARSPLRVADLGCGVGASLIWLVQQGAYEGVGVTVSPTQAAWATHQARQAKVAEKATFREASFTALPADIGEFDLGYSIEAFVHSPDPRAYLREVARHLRPGGKLVIIDDYLTERGAAAERGPDARWVSEFRHGWLVSSLVTVHALESMAAEFSLRLTRNSDLTPYMELGRPRDLAIAALVSVGRHFPIRSYRWRSWLGGNALQRGLATGVFEHRVLVFEKQA